MNADIVKELRWMSENDEWKFAAETMAKAADLIESLQSQLAEANEQIEYDNNLVKKLNAQLAIARRRAEKAIADLKYIAVCETCKKSGVTEYPESAVIQCEYYDSECGCGKYEWRGDAEEGAER